MTKKHLFDMRSQIIKRQAFHGVVNTIYERTGKIKGYSSE